MSFFFFPSLSASRRQWPAADDAGNGTRLYLDQTAGVHVCGRRPRLLACHPSMHPSIPPVHPSQPLWPLPCSPPLPSAREAAHTLVVTDCWMQLQSRHWAYGPASPSEQPSFPSSCGAQNATWFIPCLQDHHFPLDSTEQHRRRPCGPGGVWSIASPGAQLLLTVAGWLVGQSAASNSKCLSRLNAKGAQARASAALYLDGSPPSLRASERSRHGAAEHCEPSEFLASREEVGILNKPEPSLAMYVAI